MKLNKSLLCSYGGTEMKAVAVLRRFIRDEQGLELVEYAVMLALIVAVLIIAIIGLSGAVESRFNTTTDLINNPPT